MSERIVKFVKIKEIPKKKHLGNAISSPRLLANLSLSHEERLTRREDGGEERQVNLELFRAEGNWR